MNDFDTATAIKAAFKRLELITEELGRVKRALQAAQEGKPFDEAFNEELYLAEADRARSLNNHLMILMEHLLKLKYCAANRCHNEWLKMYRRTRNDVITASEWLSDNPDIILINDMKEHLAERYKYAIQGYIHASKEYDDLKPNMNYIPDGCPWTLENLIDDTLSELLNKLPDPDDLTVQMMLFPQICVYRDPTRLDEKVYGKQCGEWCQHYPDCVRKYAEMRHGVSKQ